MSYLLERVSYLRGLADGLEVEGNSKESKVLIEMISILTDIAEAVNDLDDEVGVIDEYVEMIDEDLDDLEEYVYDEEDDDDDDDDLFDFEEIECPYCGEVIMIDEDLFEDGACETEFTCPKCAEVFVIDNDECDESLDEE
jgi:predicted RNA-binding Zn-ribbon protein involved in translation (DUF1610 family)